MPRAGGVLPDHQTQASPSFLLHRRQHNFNLMIQTDCLRPSLHVWVPANRSRHKDHNTFHERHFLEVAQTTLFVYHWPKFNVMVTLATRETGRCNFSLGQSWSQLQNGVLLSGSGAYSPAGTLSTSAAAPGSPVSDCGPFVLRDFQWQSQRSLLGNVMQMSSAGIRFSVPFQSDIKIQGCQGRREGYHWGTGVSETGRNKMSYTCHPSMISGEGRGNKTETIGLIPVCCVAWGSVSSSVKWGKLCYWEEKIMSLF